MKPHCDICGAETSDLVDFLCPACREMHRDESWHKSYKGDFSDVCHFCGNKTEDLNQLRLCKDCHEKLRHGVCDYCHLPSNDLAAGVCGECRASLNAEAATEAVTCPNCGAEKDLNENICDNCKAAFLLEDFLEIASEADRPKILSLDNLLELSQSVAADKPQAEQEATQQALFQYLAWKRFEPLVTFWKERLNGQAGREDLQAILEQIAAYVDPVSHAEQQAADFIENLWRDSSDENEAE